MRSLPGRDQLINLNGDPFPVDVVQLVWGVTVVRMCVGHDPFVSAPESVLVLVLEKFPTEDIVPAHDSSIIVRMRQGDTDALVEFIEEKRALLLAFIQKRVGTHLKKKIELEDILQDVSVEAIRSFDKACIGDRDPLSWLFHLSERKIIDAHRHFFASQKRDASREAALAAGTQGSGLENLLIASMTTPSQAFSRDQKQLKMLAALETLPEDQREALRLRYLVGLPSKDVAEKLGKSDGAVRVMLSRSLARLQQLMAEA